MEFGSGTAINGVKVCANSAIVEDPHLVIARFEDKIKSKIFLSNSKI